MSIRRVTILVVAVTFLGLIIVMTLDLERTLVRHFDNDEQQTMLREIERFKQVLGAEYNSLAKIGQTWGQWDETYKFATGKSPEYVKQYLPDITLQNLDANLLLLADSDGNVLYQKYIDLETNGELKMPDLVLSELEAGGALAFSPEHPSGVNGMMIIDGEPLLVHVRPVLPTDGSGPTGGMFVVGRLLNSERLQYLSDLTNLSLTIRTYYSGQLENDFQMARQQLSIENSSTVIPISAETIAGFYLLTDLRSEPAAIVRLDEARRIHQNGIRVMNYLITALILASFTFGVMILVMLEQLVFSRLFRLSADVNQIGKSGDISSQVSVKGRDEISRLAQVINTMLADLSQSQKRRLESEERFRSLVDAMDDIVFTINRDLTEVNVFGRWMEKYAIPTRLFLGEDGEGIEKQAAEIHRAANRRVLEGEHLVFDWAMECGGKMCHFQTSLSPMRDSSGMITGIAGVGRNTNLQREMEASLRQRVNDLAMLYRVSHLLLSEINAAKTLSNVCQLVVEQFDLMGAWVGREVEDRLKPDLLATSETGADLMKLLYERAGNESPVVQSIQTGLMIAENDLGTAEGDTMEAARAAGCRSMVVLPLSTGEREARGVLALYSTQPGRFMDDRLQMIQSIANLAAMAFQNSHLYEQVVTGQARLQDLSRQLVDVQEDERRKIALELHDEIGQILTGLKMLLDVEAKASAAGDPRSRLNEAQTLVNELIVKVREMSLDLRPAMLDDLGLLPALLWQITRYTAQTGIQVGFQHAGIEGIRLPQEVETAAYRIVQESLTNTARYAGVCEVMVRLWRTDGVLGIQVEDQGKGFNPQTALDAAGGRGLLGMRERSSLLGGTLMIDSEPGRGTHLSVEIPVAGYEGRQENEH